MGISLVTIRSNVLRDLGVDSTDLDSSGSTNLDLLINKSWWDVMDKFNFKEKESRTTFALTAGTNQYDIAAKVNTASSIIFDALQSIYVLDDNDISTPLDEISRREFESLNIDASNNESLPTNYMRDAGYIYLTPTPDSAYTLIVYHLTILGDVPSNGPVIPQSWHEIIELGAIWRGHMIFRDFNSATDIQKVQLGLISRALTVPSKEDHNNKMAAVSVPFRPTGRRY